MIDLDARRLPQQVSHPLNWQRVDGKNLETNGHAIRARRNEDTSAWEFVAERMEKSYAPRAVLGTFTDVELAKVACAQDWSELSVNKYRKHTGPQMYCPKVKK